ncbi:MAG: tRNA 2-selenouridine(34) synthase MnmH [Ferruginibacter sp.]
MAVQKITIQQFLELAEIHPVLDVRSPGEYMHAHIPGAYSLPLFTDEERKVVGTAYKQQNRQIAIKIGLDYFGVKMKAMVEKVEDLFKNRIVENASFKDAEASPNCVLVHCWRGGMRSAGVAWLLDLYGFKVYSLAGGYKKYRELAREQFEKKLSLNIIGGYTGSGKTLVLQELKQAGKHILDLEGLANHKGSTFGALGEKAQPSQEMFENLLAKELRSIQKQQSVDTDVNSTQNESHVNADLPENVIYVEDESQRIGLINIPGAFWQQMRNARISFFNIPFEERLNYLTEAYGKFETEKLVNAVIRIQKRLGGLETKNAVNFLLENNQKECFRILLKYYDKWYSKGLLNRGDLPSLLHKIECATVNTKSMIHALNRENLTA